MPRHSFILALALLAPISARTQAALTPDQAEARAIFQQLIDTKTSYKDGATAPAAHAIAQRFLDAGFPAADVHVLGPVGDKDSNVVVRLQGTSKSLKPILLIAHLDVVEALRTDWSVDPYKLTERDGFFYGRGSSDIKGGAATLAEALLRLKREHIVPERTLILALTAGEEGGGGYNGISWLLDHHRDLIDAEFCLNTDGGDPLIKDGKRIVRPVQASEKLYQSYYLTVTNKGGHSSMPTPDNAIATLAEAIGRVSRFHFPVHLNETTRAYFERSAALQTGQTAADMRAIAKNERDSAAAARLSMSPFYNAQLRTTCTPTMLEGGHAPNALPQTARALVNCRILPGETPVEVQAVLVRVVANDSVKVTPIDSGKPGTASPLLPVVMKPVETVTQRLWPGVPVIPQMETGATDGWRLRDAGIPTYGVSGIPIDVDDERAHGRDERIMVTSFYEGVEYMYQLVKEVAVTPTKS
ncbi:MAG: M20/M25/M40 family metallo-hydrolase [Gemmatimonadaceae bacterium]|nr:M20/M25/M40 family metallo-hydrolase [Gemmatimonadaceae bacterium]